MSGIQGHVLGHIVRRGVNHIAGYPDEYVEMLQQNAEAYENSDLPEVKFHEMIPIIVTAFIVFIVSAMINYTVGEVVAAMSMIESQTATAVVEDKPPAYADEPDAPLAKEGLLPVEAVADVEVTLIRNVPVTAKISTAVRHLTRIGGFRGRFRGAAMSGLYHIVHSFATDAITSCLGHSFIFRPFVFVLVSVLTARLHMLWTHTMIAHPTDKPWYRRFVARKDARAVYLPALVYALAQQATIFLPMAVASTVGLTDVSQEQLGRMANEQNGVEAIMMLLSALAVPATAIFVALAILLPALVTLTRIEALLLPEDQETIVPFDRQAIVANIDMTKRCTAGALFTSAWRSFDRASRWRLVKLYTKIFFMQMALFITGTFAVLAELYVIGGERIAVFLVSASAQIQLALMEAAAAEAQ